VAETWKTLGMDLITHKVCSVEVEGRSTLEALLRDNAAKAPLLPKVDRNDLAGGSLVCFVEKAGGNCSNNSLLLSMLHKLLTIQVSCIKHQLYM
jgi:hypothetical protein